MPRALPTALLVLAVLATPAAGDPLDIPWSKHVLENGLTLIVHEDPDAPVVAVNVWYHVGSKDERPGRSGFSHLFEHLMFHGSENHPGDYLQALERVGATEINGTTNPDRTSYHQDVPPEALDLVLWMESDRMGNLLGALDQEKLDEQRGVVTVEIRQEESRPYGIVKRLLAEGTYPAGHPYSRTPSGSADDLAAADLEDVYGWFERFYGAANAVIVLAGDVDFETAKQKVEHYFGWIPAGPPRSRAARWIAPMSGTRRHRVEDRVDHGRLYFTWNVPPLGDPDLDALNLLSDVLARGRSSRLQDRLVLREGLATEVLAYVIPREVGSQFRIQATAAPGVDLPTLERAVDEELNRLLRDGPTRAETDRARAGFRADFARRAERVGGAGGKSDLLAQCEVYLGDPGCHADSLRRVQEADAEQLVKAGRAWLSDGVHVLEVRHFPEHRTTPDTVDRSAPPYPAGIADARFPTIHRAELTNGLPVLVVPRPGSPLVRLDLLVDAGWAADGDRPGLATLAWELLAEGTAKRTGIELAEALAGAGGELTTEVDLDLSKLSLSGPSGEAEALARLLAEIVRFPSYPAESLERARAERLRQIAREAADPYDAALRILPSLLYPQGHPYRTPLTGSGTSASVESIERADLLEFHEARVRPGRSHLLVVGDTTPEAILPVLERELGAWRPGESVSSAPAEPGEPATASVILVDQPGAARASVFATRVVPPRSHEDGTAFDALDLVLGGTFSSRINRNLREDKHWTQGARTRSFDARGPRPWFAHATVHPSRAAEAMREIRMEIEGLAGDRGVTTEELERVRTRQTLRRPGLWETGAGLADALEPVVRHGPEDGHPEHLVARIRSLTPEDLDAVARRLLDPGRLHWVVVADAEAVAEEIRALGFGEVRIVAPE